MRALKRRKNNLREWNDEGERVAGTGYIMVEMVQHLISKVNMLKEVVNTGIEKQNKLQEKLDELRRGEILWMEDQFSVLSKDVTKM
ncbi:hypothetical protein V6N13_148701 [Hibiscus sabdariffa]|uniref:Uncharacterized protein n=1 Tax=Hibiscus sabdariffa TaxID=183260 RepID=A0ABR2EJL4_9ROSI